MASGCDVRGQTRNGADLAQSRLSSATSSLEDARHGSCLPQADAAIDIDFYVDYALACGDGGTHLRLLQIVDHGCRYLRHEP
jgi:hypothetical protein